MARPESNTVDYFPHPTNQGRKMRYMRSKYGNDGYAVWYCLLEQLGNAPNHFLDLSDEVNRMLVLVWVLVWVPVLVSVWV